MPTKITTKITLIIDNPARLEAFELQVPELLARAGALPGLLRLESAKVWPKEDGTPTPAHRTLDLYFEDYDAASRAVGTTEAGTLLRHSRPPGSPSPAYSPKSNPIRASIYPQQPQRVGVIDRGAEKPCVAESVVFSNCRET